MMRDTYRNLLEVTEHTHETMASAMNTEIEKINLYEAGQLFQMVNRQLYSLHKMMQFLREKVN
jgi:hypothetical protein